MPRLRLATRGSPQARTQAEAVAAALAAAAGCETELVIVDTTGDRRQDVPLHVIGGQGVFVKEVQQAVLDGRADVAVHSAKDLPSASHEALVIGAFMARRDAADALIGRSLADLAPGATIATGSVRRRAQLAAARPDLAFVELRGNIATRLSKVPDGGAIVMAVAALQVLGMTERIDERLDPRAVRAGRRAGLRRRRDPRRRLGDGRAARRRRRRHDPPRGRGRAQLPRRARVGLLAARSAPTSAATSCTCSSPATTTRPTSASPSPSTPATTSGPARRPATPAGSSAGDAGRWPASGSPSPGRRPASSGTRLAALGATVVHVPLIEIGDPVDGGVQLRAALARLAAFDWLVVTSVNGADARRSGRRRPPGAAPGRRRPGDGRRARRGRRSSTSTSCRPTAARRGPARRVPAASRPGSSLAQADRARRVLADGLAARGHAVESVIAYRTVARRPSPDEVTHADDAPTPCCWPAARPPRRWADAVGADAAPPCWSPSGR